MRFFLDHCISPRLAAALDTLSEPDGHEVIALRDRFDPGTPDEEWLSGLAREGDWIVVSGDYRIYHNKHRRKAWQQARLTSFFWQRAWNNRSYWEKNWRMVRWWPDILNVAGSVAKGAGFSIPFGSTRLKPL